MKKERGVIQTPLFDSSILRRQLGYYSKSLNTSLIESSTSLANTEADVPRSSAAYSPACAWIHAPATAASNASRPWARKPTINPARTSPVPARARAGEATGITVIRPSGDAMTVNAPLRTTTCPHSFAYLLAISCLFSWISSFDNPVSTDISPGCGVKIAGVDIFFDQSEIFASNF